MILYVAIFEEYDRKVFVCKGMGIVFFSGDKIAKICR